jgi:hypothetical protein
MRLRLQTYSFRFAEQVLNSKLSIKQEIETVLLDPGIDLPILSRPMFKKILDELFPVKGWKGNQRYSTVLGILLQKWIS